MFWIFLLGLFLRMSCLHVRATCVFGALTGQKRVKELQLQITASCCIGAWNQTCILCKNNKRLASGPPLQPPTCLFYHMYIWGKGLYMPCLVNGGQRTLVGIHSHSLNVGPRNEAKSADSGKHLNPRGQLTDPASV